MHFRCASRRAVPAVPHKSYNSYMLFIVFPVAFARVTKRSHLAGGLHRTSREQPRHATRHDTTRLSLINIPDRLSTRACAWTTSRYLQGYPGTSREHPIIFREHPIIIHDATRHHETHGTRNLGREPPGIPRTTDHPGNHLDQTVWIIWPMLATSLPCAPARHPRVGLITCCPQAPFKSW